MKIAILGSTSQIAKDLILNFYKSTNYDLSLFARNVELMESWMCNQNLSNQYRVGTYAEFNSDIFYDVIINFVGAGDPAKIQKIEHEIVAITEQYDNMVLEYIKRHNRTKYIFLSSGAVFGGDYQSPVNENTSIDADNSSGSLGRYVVAKQSAEKKHRALTNLSIVDIRVFNYFSHTQDTEARFLISDIVRALKNKEVFNTSSDDVVRDFITPIDFCNLIQSIIDFKPINITVDCYTKLPVSKFDLLLKLKEEFGLQYCINKDTDFINPTGFKLNYYSTNRAAEALGFIPSYTALDGIVEEIKLMQFD